MRPVPGSAPGTGIGVDSGVDKVESLIVDVSFSKKEA
jgi:hypothetical protein